jgi:CDP-diacylglycerol---glycerol-3-phosphate 3-phosphatidyltransferase
MESAASHTVPSRVAQIPNALTIFRLVLIPAFVALLLGSRDGPSWPAGIVFAVAGATDQLDGFLARRWRVESAFGKVADPLADRIMIDVAVVLLAVFDRLPWAALAIVVGRDLTMILGYKVVMPRGYDFDVNLAGKTATWVLYASTALVLVTEKGTDWPLWLFWTGVALALAAAAGYAARAVRTVRA